MPSRLQPQKWHARTLSLSLSPFEATPPDCWLLAAGLWLMAAGCVSVLSCRSERSGNAGVRDKVIPEVSCPHMSHNGRRPRSRCLPDMRHPHRASRNCGECQARRGLAATAADARTPRPAATAGEVTVTGRPIANAVRESGKSRFSAAPWWHLRK